MTADTLLAEFDDAMLLIYKWALSEAGYNATRFLQMLQDRRGLETAKILLHSPKYDGHYTLRYVSSRFVQTLALPFPPSRKTKSAGLKPGTYITRSIRKLSHFLPLCFQKLAHTRGWVGILSRQHPLSDFSAQFSPNSFRCCSYEKSHESREHASCKYFACHSYRSTFC